jgi:tight adherence protein B
MDLLISTLVFSLVMVVGLIVATARSGDRGKASALLDEVMEAARNPAELDLTRDDPRRRVGQTEALDWLYRHSWLLKLDENIQQAGLHVRVSEMLLIIVLLLGSGALIGRLFFGDLLFELVCGIAAGAIPVVFIRVTRTRRLKAFNQQLPFALDLIKSSLEAGHSLLRGLQVMVQEFKDPLAGEFRTVLEQIRLGMELTRAFDELLKRLPDEDLRLMVVAIKVQSQVGSSLAQIVGRLSEIVRTRQRLQQQIRTMTAQARMSGMIVGLLPIIVLATFSLIQPGYTHLLFYDPVGIKVVKAAITLDSLAFFTIRRIVRVNY